MEKTEGRKMEPVKEVGKSNEIRFSVYYERDSNKGTSLIYKEGIPLTKEQEEILGVAYASHPRPITQSLYLNLKALQERFQITGAVKGFDVILIPKK